MGLSKPAANSSAPSRLTSEASSSNPVPSSSDVRRPTSDLAIWALTFLFALSPAVQARPAVRPLSPASGVRRPASGPARLYLNGQEVPGMKLLLRAGSVFLPVTLAKALGAEVYLQPGSRSATVVAPGHLFRLRDGTTGIESRRAALAQAPLWKDGMLFVPPGFWSRLGGQIEVKGLGLYLRRVPLVVDGPAVSADPEKLRVMLSLPHRTGTSLQVDGTGTVTLRVHGAAWSSGERPPFPASDRLLQGIETDQDPGTVQVRLHLRYPAPVDLYWLGSPTRLVLEAPRTFSRGRVEQVTSGLRHTHLIRSLPERQMEFHLLRVSLTDPRLSVRPGLAFEADGDRKLRTRLATVSALARHQGARAAVNAGYFSSKLQAPLGVVMVDRQLLSPPLYNRSALGLTQEGRAVIARSPDLVDLAVLVEGRDGRSCDAVNPSVPPDGLVLYTPSFGPRTPVPVPGREPPVEFAVGPDGTVLTQGSAPQPIPAGGFVLSGRGAGGRWLRQVLQLGKTAALVVDPAGRSGMVHAVGGGPRLLQNGRLHVNGEEELFKDDILHGRSPRTAAAIPADNRELLLLVADGRQPEQNLPGLTLEETALLLQEAGAREALNFDGGGSSTLYLNGRVANSPSDGQERPVGGMLLVVPTP